MPGLVRSAVAAVAVGAVAAALTACMGTGVVAEPTEPAGPTVRVGAWPGVEPTLLGQILAGLLEAEGIDAEIVSLADPADARQALELADVDVLVGYTGAAWLEVLERSDPPGDMRTSFARVREFDEGNGITWVRPVFGRDGSFTESPVNATFAFFVQGPPSRNAVIATLSDLASRLAQDESAQLCMDQDFANRPDGREALFRAYGMSLERQDIAAAPADAVLAVVNGQCLAALSTASDGAAWRVGLQPVEDDLEVFPAFVIATQVRDEARLAVPGLVPAVAPLTSQLTAELLGGWNARILNGAAPATVAADAVQRLRALAGREANPTASS